MDCLNKSENTHVKLTDGEMKQNPTKQNLTEHGYVTQDNRNKFTLFRLGVKLGLPHINPLPPINPSPPTHETPNKPYSVKAAIAAASCSSENFGAHTLSICDCAPLLSLNTALHRRHLCSLPLAETGCTSCRCWDR